MDRRKPTVQMLGRFQPWHDGHRELFKRAHGKTGQVVIMVRNTGEEYHDRGDMIRDLEKHGYTYHLDFEIMDVPIIVNITYGRDFGYVIEQENFDKEIERISGTSIRNKQDSEI